MICRCGAEAHDYHCCAEPVKIEVPDPRPCAMCAQTKLEFDLRHSWHGTALYDGHHHTYNMENDGRLHFWGDGRP